MGKLRADLRADFAHFGERHRFVGFVFEIESAAAFEIVADKAVEDDDGAIFGGFQRFR